MSAFTAQLPKITPTNQSDEQREAHDNLSISKIRLCKRKPRKLGVEEIEEEEKKNTQMTLDQFHPNAS